MNKTTQRLWALASLLLFSPSMALAGTLSDTPLSLKGSVPPNVMFALSVEFPTALVAAYQGQNDYSAGLQYQGYFDSDKCYTYNSAVTTANNSGYFTPNSWATNHGCSGTGLWSGNFLNWATMSGLDEFRYAMTGGYRSTDTATLTVLERSYQNTQGNYFPTKTITNQSATGTPATLTINSYGQGVQMKVDLSGGDTANCTNPTESGSTFSCAFSLQSSGHTANCSAWTGNGNSSTPYQCTSFGAWSGGESFSSLTVGTKTQASTLSNTSVTCSGPPSDMSSGNFNCVLTMSNGTTGSCTAWQGNGSSSAPFSCSTFGTFGGDNFLPSSQAAATTFSATTTSSTSYTDNITASSCTGVPATNSKITCPLSPAGKTISCTIKSGTGSSSSPYRCNTTTSTWSANDTSYSWVNATIPSSGSTNYGGKYYRFPTAIAYTVSTTATNSYYYIPSYSGSDANPYWYYSTYNVGISGSNYYNARVEVCNTTIGQESNCKQYGTSWKPTGVVQDNGDKMRFGAMSYFMSNDIDNAVLRSKLKYVAPQKYSAGGGTVANSVKEWSETDGTLIQNPDVGDAATYNSFIGTSSNSGVINYINKFGLVSGYKGYDDVGKLYYETLRYLRGLAPTPAFYQGAKTSNADGFPVITTWDDPVQYSCQKNYIITLGDQFTHCDKRLPGGTLSNSASQCNAYTDGNGNNHPADSGSLSNGDTVNVTTETNALNNLDPTATLSNLATTQTGAGSASFYMSGLAAWAARNDIRPDDSTKPQTLTKQTVKTFVINVEENKSCGYNSQFWLAAKFGNPASYDSNGNWLTTGNPWSQSMALSAGACNSNSPPGYASSTGGTVTWPKNLLRASNPSLMISSVKSAIADIVSQIGDESALAQSSGSLNTGTGAYIYRATYNSGGWTGTVDAYTIDTSGIVSSTAAWTASAKLPTATSRNILTFNDGLTTGLAAESTAKSRQGVSFDETGFSASPSNFSSLQLNVLNKDEFGTTDNLGIDRINYLRGDRSNEAPSGNAWRARTVVLGDNINSNPLYVGPPSGIQPGNGYSTFARNHALRLPMLYVGANDGMLHGYDASYGINSAGTPVITSTSGTELVAYIPSPVYSNLNKLMSPNYSHKYYVDGSPVSSNVYFGGTCSAGDQASHPENCWHTMLVGGLNAGGQGIYALDITNPGSVLSNGSIDTTKPGSLDASKVLWEFTDKDDRHLGYTFGKPIIRKINLVVNGVTQDRWAVIFGNGYNNTTADGSASDTGRAYLYVLLAEGPGNGNHWTLGTDYFRIELKSPSEPSSPTLPLSPPNGLSSVAGIDKDQNGTVDLIYAGDRNGNVWKIDISSTDPTQWKAAFGTSPSTLPLFSAKDSASTPNAQQITTGIEVQRHPISGYMVLFGTGSWIDITDPLSPFKTDSFYGIWDKDDSSTTTHVTGRSLLQKQSVIANIDSTGTSCVAGSTGCYVIMSNCSINYSTPPTTASNQTGTCPATIASPAHTTQQFGWVFDFPGSGERTFSDRPKLSSADITFTSVQPASDPCSGNTAGVEYTFDWLTGGASSTPVYIVSGTTGSYLSITIGGTTYSVVASGITISGGAADTGISFNATPPTPNTTGTCDATCQQQQAAAAICGSSSSFPSSSCVGTDCGATYIPGWGFAWERQGGTSGAKRCLVDCKPAQVGTALNCSWKINQDQAGRFSWRQIVH